MRKGISKRRALARRAKALIEVLEQRVLLSSISGSLHNDLNGDGQFTPGEPALVGWTVFLDQNNNRVLDAGEISTTTDSAGQYTFGNLSAGTYYIAEQTPPGWKQTYPTLDHPGVNEGQATPAPALAHPVTTTGSTVGVKVQGEPSPTSGTNPAPDDATSNNLIRLNAFQSDGRFSGIDGRGYSIAVLDTGIDLNSPYFGPDTNGDGVDDRIVYQHDFADNDSDASDVQGHGSNVASIAAGQDATNPGMAPGANIIALKVFGDSGSGQFSYIEQALQWVVSNASAYNIVAVNMSLGDNQNWTTPQQLYGISDELQALASENVIVVSAAGNSYFEFKSPGVSYPAADPNSLGVGAVYDANLYDTRYIDGAEDFTTGPDRIASFSQRSKTLTDVFAPGSQITGANYNGGSISYSGTSQAAPHIAGIAVLAQQLAEQHLGRRLTPAEFKALLKDTSTTIFDGDDENTNVPASDLDYGRVDVENLADAIYRMGAGEYDPLGHKVVVGSTDRAGLDFGASVDLPTPSTPQLQSQSDTGISSADRVTRLDNSSPSNRLTFLVPNVRAGLTVNLYAGSTLIGSMTALASKCMITTDGATDIPDGLAAITATAQAPGLGESSPSPQTNITIDTTPPATPPAPDLDPRFDSGISNTDNITHSAYLNLSLGGAPYFRIYRNGSLFSNQYQYASSAWAPNYGGLADGTAQYTVSAVDAAGNESVSPPLTMTIDAAPSPGVDGPGTLDTSFGNDGVISSTGERDALTHVALQSDGKIVAAGTEDNGTGDAQGVDWVLVRYNADGSIDSSFGDGGRATVHVADFSEADCLLVQSDGKIVLGGAASTNLDGGWYTSRLAVTRFNSDGSLDTSFASGGVFQPTTYPMIYNGAVEQMAQQPDGKLLLSYSSSSNGDYTDFGVARLTVSGALDTTFSGDGWAQADFNHFLDDPSVMYLLPNGRILVMGYTTTRSTNMNSVALARFMPDGSLDTTYDGDGKLITTFSPQYSYTHIPSAMFPDGTIRFLEPLNSASELVSLDPETGQIHGTMLIDFSAHALTAQADGSFIVVGSKSGLHRQGSGDVVERFQPNGAYDPSFGDSPLASIYVWPEIVGNEFFNDVLVQPDGKIVAVGETQFAYNNLYYPSRFALARFNGGSFTPGALTLEPSSDAGYRNFDQITSDNTPTFDLPDLVGGSANMYRDFTLVQSNVSGPTWTSPPAPDGFHDYEMRYVDLAGNEYAPNQTRTSLTIDTTAPAPAFSPVSPSMLQSGLDQVTIGFGDSVTQLSLDDFTLTRDGTPISLGTGVFLRTNDDITWTISGLASLTDRPGTYAIAVGTGYQNFAGLSPAIGATVSWGMNAINGTSGDDSIVITRSAGTGNSIDVSLNGAPAYSVDATALGQILVNASGGNDVLTLNGTDDDDTLDFAGNSVTFTTGAASLELSLSNFEHFAFNGGAGNDALKISAGAYVFDTDASLGTQNLAISMTGGSVTFDAVQHLRALSISGGIAAIPAGQSGVLVVGDLSVAGTGSLDLNDNDLIIRDGAPGTFAGGAYDGVSGLIESGAIRSSAAQDRSTTLGVATGANLFGINASQTANWNGQTVGAGDVLVKFTYVGDANLDGKVNIDDYGRIDANVGQSGSVFGWYNGDFNLDGKINIDDYGLIDGIIGAQGPVL